MKFGRLSACAVIIAASLWATGAARAGATEVVKGLGTPVIKVKRLGTSVPVNTARVASAVSGTGATTHPVRYAALPMTSYAQQGQSVLKLPAGWRVPMGTMVLPVEYVRALGGDRMAGALAPGTVLMGEDSAAIRDAAVGDVVTLRDSRNRPRQFTVSMIVSNEIAGGEDLVMSSDDGRAMGVTKVSYAAIVGFPTYRGTVNALKRGGFAVGPAYRVRTTWGPQSPDETLGLAQIKRQLGEFSFRPTDSAAIMVQDSWRASQIDWFHRYSALPLRNNCHKKVVDAIEGAFREIVDRGLRSKIDIGNSQRYGGCYVGRYNRFAGLFGSPSRHAFGGAIDLNTAANAQGGRPRMNCEVVRIFRKWGFAWGGNFWIPDGMHFEWVGERRDRVGFASTYCPNKVPVPAVGEPTTTTTTTTTSTSTTSTTTTTVPETTTTTVPVTTTT